MFGRKKIRNIITISGTVQGVGFRYGARSSALTLGVSGVVRNMHDGTVRVEVEGPRDAVEKFADWCREGPSYARVAHITVEELPPVGLKGFEVIE